MNSQGVQVNPIGEELRDYAGMQPLNVGNENKQTPAENWLGDALRMSETQEPQHQNNYRVHFNIVGSDGPLVLPPLSLGHTFVVNTSLMKILIQGWLLAGLASDVPHAHIAKLMVLCESCVGWPDWDMDVIGYRVFPQSLAGNAVVVYNELHTIPSIHGTNWTKDSLQCSFHFPRI